MNPAAATAMVAAVVAVASFAYAVYASFRLVHDDDPSRQGSVMLHVAVSYTSLLASSMTLLVAGFIWIIGRVAS